MGWKENKAIRDLEYSQKNRKRIPFDVQISEYEHLKQVVKDTPVITYVKQALNAYSGEEIFKIKK